jgi:xanthine/CO dehydrogenase XdhC/CoxF family maturation factor
MTSHDNDVLNEASLWLGEGRKVAVATVVRTWGSSPRPVGSQLVIDERGRFAGSVSGGCIEAAVAHEALRVIENGTPKLIEFGVTNQAAWEVGLACGGHIEIFVEPVE